MKSTAVLRLGQQVRTSCMQGGKRQNQLPRIRKLNTSKILLLKTINGIFSMQSNHFSEMITEFAQR